MRTLLALAASLLATLTLAAPAAYDVFPGTISPDGRFAIAWGVPGVAIDSERLREADGENEYVGEVLAQASRAQNYLVDLKKKSIVAMLAGFKGHYRESHGGVSASWSRAEPVAVVTHHGRWEPRALALVSVSGSQAPLLERLRNDVRNYLRRKGGKSYAAVKERLAYEINNAQLLPGKLTLTVTASVPGEEEGYSTTVWAVYHFRVQGGQVRIAGSRVLPQGARK